MKRTRLFALLIALPLVLSGCGEEKKIKINDNTSITTTTQPTNSPANVPTLNPNYIDAFGNKLAPFHNVTWDAEFDAYSDNEKYHVSINTYTTVSSKNVDNVILFSLLPDEDALRYKFFDAFFEKNEYFHQDTIYPYEKDYNRIKASYERAQKDLDAAIEAGANEDAINEQRSLISNIPRQLEEYKQLYQHKLEDITANPAQKEDPNAFYCHVPSREEIINISFKHHDKPVESRFHPDYIGCDNEINDFCGVVITGIPAPQDIYDYNNDQLLDLLNSYLSKLDLPLCDNIYVETTTCYNEYYELLNQISISAAPKLKNDFQIPFYHMYINADTIDFHISHPASIIETVENVPLLSLDEIKSIAKKELEEHFDIYKAYVNEDGKLNLHNHDIVFENAHDEETSSIIPVWSFYTDECTSSPIFCINAIDGSVQRCD